MATSVDPNKTQGATPPSKTPEAVVPAAAPPITGKESQGKGSNGKGSPGHGRGRDARALKSGAGNSTLGLPAHTKTVTKTVHTVTTTHTETTTHSVTTSTDGGDASVASAPAADVGGKPATPPPGGSPGATPGVAPVGSGESAGPRPSYESQFGHQSYVKDGSDGKLLGQLKQAASLDPALANGALGKAVQSGKVGPAELKELQHTLQQHGYSLGHAGVDGKYGPQTHAALQAYIASGGQNAPGTPASATAATSGENQGQAPAGPGAAAAPGQAPGQPMKGLGLKKDGLTIPNGGEGKGTVFWNGHIPYKGAVDKENMQNGGKGAWGDANKPTDYAIALPVGSSKWHNQKVLITNPQTGKQVVALVQDKGPAARTGAKIDMTPVVMEGLGVPFKRGSAHVKFEFAPPDAKVGPVN